MDACILLLLTTAAAASFGDPHGKTTIPLCAAAVVLPFDSTRPFNASRAGLHPNSNCVERFSDIRAVRERPRERLTIGYTYYCDVHHLEHHLRHWNKFPVVVLDRIHFLIVDDGSPDEVRAAPVVARNAEAAASSYPASGPNWRIGRQPPSPTQASRSSRSNRTLRGTLGALGICSSR